MQQKSFAELGLSQKALHALDRAGFEHPTPIQAQAIPPALAGKDVIGTAATGTG
ncbi:MAG TPA: DEAD/DEAH box helicase, partial [Anaeromyxobacter sp.]